MGVDFNTSDEFPADDSGYEAGDKDARFTIQSVSKAIVYGLALEDWGHAEVRH